MCKAPLGNYHPSHWPLASSRAPQGRQGSRIQAVDLICRPEMIAQARGCRWMSGHVWSRLDTTGISCNIMQHQHHQHPNSGRDCGACFMMFYGCLPRSPERSESAEAVTLSASPDTALNLTQAQILRSHPLTLQSSQVIGYLQGCKRKHKQ